MELFSDLDLELSKRKHAGSDAVDTSFDDGALWAYSYLMNWRCSDTDGYPEPGVAVLWHVQYPGPSAALMIGHYSKGFNEWVPMLGGMAPTSSKKVLGWRPLSW